MFNVLCSCSDEYVTHIGFHTIRLTAVNYSNSPAVEITISIVSKIENLSISSSDNLVYSKNPFQYEVHLKGGNNVTVKIDYGNGISNETFVKDAYNVGRGGFCILGSYR